ncbi:MAG: aspartate dehydrogenase [Burkholderiaceae bacterium]
MAMHPHPLKVGLFGLGTIGAEVAARLCAGIDGLRLVAVAARDHDKARRTLTRLGVQLPVLDAAALAAASDVVLESAPASVFAEIASATIEAGRIFMPLSVGALLERMDLIERAQLSGARIIVPTGALLGLDAVRAAAEGTIHSVTAVTRKPPRGLQGAPYLVEHGIDLAGLEAPKLVFEGNAREAARGFPANVNVIAALSLAGIGPDRTRLQIWADPGVDRNQHRIQVEADSARFTLEIEGIPTAENPATGRITALSAVACLRGLVSTLKVGS